MTNDRTKANAIVRLSAGHDENGNPLRVFVILDCESQIMRVYDEGYGSASEVLQNHPELRSHSPVTFQVPVSEYRELTGYPSDYWDMRR
jgi:hypothetical protein